MKVIFLTACGLYNLGMAVFHVWAMKGLHISQDLKYAMPMTRSFCRMLNVGMAFWLAYAGLICLFCGSELHSTMLGAVWLAGWAVFWWGRTIAHWWLFGAGSKHFGFWITILAAGSVLYTASAGRGFINVLTISV